MNIEDQDALRARIAALVRVNETLAAIAGIFDPAVSGRGVFRASGLYLLRVQVVGGGLKREQPYVRRCAGDCGSIGWSYPVTASIFNFAIEAPVLGLSVAPQASLGIPWRCLIALEEIR